MIYRSICIDREIKKPLFIQQHKSSLGIPDLKFMYFSMSKHEMTDIYTVCIWKIKYKAQ